jgi:hypothetical protein
MNYKTQEFAKEFERATGGHGADVVIDFVGASHWDKNIVALAPDGRMVMLSFLSGRDLEKVDLGPLLFKRLRIQSTPLRARSVPYQVDLVERFTRDVVGKLTGAEGHGELKTYLHKVEDVRAQGVPVDGDPRGAWGHGGEQEQREDYCAGAMTRRLRLRPDTTYNRLWFSHWTCTSSLVHVLNARFIPSGFTPSEPTPAAIDTLIVWCGQCFGCSLHDPVFCVENWSRISTGAFRIHESVGSVRSTQNLGRRAPR